MGLARGALGVTALIGLGAAILCPIAGAIAGGVMVWGAVAGTMGTGAAVCLTAAGVVGGGLVGRVAGYIVAAAAVGLAGLAASNRLVSSNDFTVKRSLANDDYAPSLAKKLGGLFAKASNDVAEAPAAIAQGIKASAPLQFKQ
ncbi:MAG: hypothetical protein ACAH80_15625 [Alphaproteobacteria bacterium]